MLFSSTALLPFAALAFLASFATANESTGASALEPRTSHFSWKHNGGSCDNLPSGGPSSAPSLPSNWPGLGQFCGTGFYYHSTYKFCVPRNNPGNNDNAGPQSCPASAPWNSNSRCCKNKCANNEFWWAGRSICLPNSPPSSQPGCPTPGYACPVNYYWSTKLKYCVPKSAPSGNPSCASGSSCDLANFLCSACHKDEFWFPFLNTCLPVGGVRNPPSPPSGHNCDTKGGGRHWHKTYKCCVPTQPTYPTIPTCTNGNWHGDSQCCIPGPQPSGRTPHGRRNHKQIVVALPLDGRVDPARCPNSLTACPLNGSDYECLDPEVELTSCGGCSSTGAGQNCLLIPNSASVTCSSGKCEVISCRQGTSLSLDGSACV